ncbi:hypothetical protein [Corynebacterium gerontici]|uniref:Uncharacterized protein n=1 Tax=Corynebacterium gerontici TaxID=2079234 RepID=A0A3G6J1B5_9CORY|nr:hypothetical protein [Corynebacterium gerontici]AZA11593.1 hypothetical protein CGERO_06465 [Corynebacterium gerontici]
MTLHTIRRGSNSTMLQARATVTEPAQVWDISTSTFAGSPTKRVRNVRTLQHAGSPDRLPPRGDDSGELGMKDTAKKLILGSSLGVFMALSVYAAAQGEHHTVPQHPQQVVSSVDGFTR